MDVSITQVPVWVSISFFVLFSTIPVFLIANTVKVAALEANIDNPSRLKRRILLFYWLYLTIIAILSLIGFFIENTLPPRIFIFSVIPLFLFYMLYIQRQQWFKSIFKQITLKQLVRIHIFRFVGVFFFIVYAYGALPKTFAFIGGAGDILTAFLAIPIIIILQRKASYTKPLVLVWNIIGLLDICSVVVTAIIITRQAIEHNEPGVQEFGTFPFSWIPAMAPATIIFLHLLIFRKLKEV